KRKRQAAGKTHAARDAVGELRRVAMARVEIGCGREDADHRAVKRLVTVAGGLEEAAAEKQRKLLVAILGQTRPQPACHPGSFPLSEGQPNPYRAMPLRSNAASAFSRPHPEEGTQGLFEGWRHTRSSTANDAGPQKSATRPGANPGGPV